MREEKRKRKKVKKVIIIILLIITILLCWSRFISTKGLIVKEYAITNNRIPSEMDGIKVIHFSDLHYGSTITKKDIDKIVKKINSYNPTLVLFTGDLIDKESEMKEEDIKYLTESLSKITAQFKYSVTGNNDDKKQVTEIFEGSDFKMLSNEKELIYYLDKTPIEIIGFPSSTLEKHDYEILNTDTNYFRIVLMHEPDYAANIKDKNIDLILAGHSHNGQVRLPFIGAIYKPQNAKNYFDEYYNLGNTKLYISSGLGTSKAKFRLLNKPSINLYRFYSEN